MPQRAMEFGHTAHESDHGERSVVVIARHRCARYALAMLLALAVLATAPRASAHEGLGFSPFVGVAWVTSGGDSSPSLTVGADLTYGFTNWFGLGVGYSRIFTPGNDDLPDTNFVDLSAIFTLPLGPLEAYASAGPGYYWEIAGPDDESGVYVDLGAGIGIDLAIVRVSGQISYRALDDGNSFFVPGVWASIGL